MSVPPPHSDEYVFDSESFGKSLGRRERETRTTQAARRLPPGLIRRPGRACFATPGRHGGGTLRCQGHFFLPQGARSLRSLPDDGGC